MDAGRYIVISWRGFLLDENPDFEQIKTMPFQSELKSKGGVLKVKHLFA